MFFAVERRTLIPESVTKAKTLWVDTRPVISAGQPQK
jgi:hypothetical protein